MTTFDDRQKAFENKFAHDAQLKFKAQARAAKLMGIWAAEKMGKTGDATLNYALEVVEADLKEPGTADIIAKIKTDLDAANIPTHDKELDTQLDLCLAQAADQILNEQKQA